MEKNYKYYVKLIKKLKKDYNYSLCKKTKDSKQFKKENGFYREDTYNLDASLIIWLLPRLAYLKDYKGGIPSAYMKDDCSFEEGQRRWKEVLQSILDGFEDYVTPSLNHLSSNSTIDNDAQEPKIDKALRLLKENFFYLWT